MGLHESFLKVNGVKLADMDHLVEFEQVISTLKMFKEDEREKMKSAGLHLTSEYLMRLDFQVLKKYPNDEAKFAALQKTTFIAEHCTKDIPEHFTNYFDGVKE